MQQGGGCSTEEGPRQRPPVDHTVQKGCLKETRLAAGHWARGTEGPAGGVDFANSYIPTPRRETSLTFILDFIFIFDYMCILGVFGCGYSEPEARGELGLPCISNYRHLHAAPVYSYWELNSGPLLRLFEILIAEPSLLHRPPFVTSLDYTVLLA